MNDLEKYFHANPGRLIHKWLHYFDIYDRHFSRFRGQSIKILEFGVYHGGSLQMWKHYFGKNAQIFGVDIDERCRGLEEDQVKIFIGDQEDRRLHQKLKAEIGPVDIVIEDGGHQMGQQIVTFEEIYPLVKPKGVFLIEDLHTSYWQRFGGGYKKSGTFIEYAKSLIDQLNAWYSKEPNKLQVDDFTRTTTSIHFYDSIAVFEKDLVKQPQDKQTGKASFEDKHAKV